MAREEKERTGYLNKQTKETLLCYIQKEKNTHYKSSDDERQKKIAMLKYTYEQVLSDQAEQVNTKRNNTNNLTAYGQKMINDSNIINMIPKNKDIRNDKYNFNKTKI